MVNVFKQIFLLLIFPCLVYSQSTKDLLGSWHASDHVASGYNDMFSFKDDGSFSFSYNEMDCSKRNTGYGGNWELLGKKVILNITFREYYTGGWYERSDGSCASDSMLVNAALIKQTVVPYEEMELKISDYKMESEDGIDRYTIELNNRKFWFLGKINN